MKRKKTKRTLKVKVIRFFQDEVVTDWLIFLTFISGFLTLIYLSAPSI